MAKQESVAAVFTSAQAQLEAGAESSYKHSNTMIITNEKPIIKPAEPEVVFSGFWASRVIVDTPTPTTKGSAMVILKPFNPESKEVLNIQEERFIIQDLWAEAEKTPEVANAVLALIHAIDIVRKKRIAEAGKEA